MVCSPLAKKIKEDWAKRALVHVPKSNGLPPLFNPGHPAIKDVMVKRDRRAAMEEAYREQQERMMKEVQRRAMERTYDRPPSYRSAPSEDYDDDYPPRGREGCRDGFDPGMKGAYGGGPNEDDDDPYEEFLAWEYHNSKEKYKNAVHRDTYDQLPRKANHRKHPHARNNHDKHTQATHGHRHHRHQEYEDQAYELDTQPRMMEPHRYPPPVFQYPPAELPGDYPPQKSSHPLADYRSGQMQDKLRMEAEELRYAKATTMDAERKEYGRYDQPLPPTPVYELEEDLGYETMGGGGYRGPGARRGGYGDEYGGRPYPISLRLEQGRSSYDSRSTQSYRTEIRVPKWVEEGEEMGMGNRLGFHYSEDAYGGGMDLYNEPPPPSYWEEMRYSGY